MKYFFIIILSACVIAAGRIFAEKYKREVKLCEGFITFLSFAEAELPYNPQTAFEMLNRFEKLNPNTLPFFKNISEPVYISISENLKTEYALSPKQKRLINEFFCSFGSGDENSSLKLIKNYRSLFGAELEECRKNCTQKIKLITRLSFLCAAGVAVILF